tara:strand:+ start:266 stop:514 length:249 start_codon:yes stop_codon:yes gene_type:complete
MTAIAMRTANWVGLPGLANWFKNLNKKLQARKQERETMYQLSKLNDRELHDLGIGRSDIRSIARGTFHDDRVEANANLKGWV